MARDQLDETPDEIDAVVASYLDQLDHGRAPSREALLAAHPAFATELCKFLNDLEGFLPLPHSTPAASDTMVYTPGQLQDEVAVTADAFRPGRQFGDYELIDMVARGGMGIVFKARQTKLDRVVALKMILTGQLAGPADIERFRTEARAAARLDHPGIVPVYEVGEHQGLHYFTMAFVDGTSLAQRLRDGPLAPKEAARLVRELAATIQFAHDSGIIHRDLKPGNVLIDRTGQPKLTDFGLAKRTDQASDMTGSGQILGTPSYMAPEQAEAGQANVGPAADVYGLGALLFALLTGRPPFQAASMLDTLLHVTKLDPPRPTILNPAVPRDLETICLKCLEKSPAKRYESAAALHNDLDRFLTDRPIQARPVSVAEKAYRWYRRRPAIGTMAAALAVLAVAVPVLLGSLWANERETREKVQKAEQARTHQLFDALVNEAAARRTSPRVGRGFQSLERIVAARDLADELKLPADEYTRLRSEAVSALSLSDVKAYAEGGGWLARRAPEHFRNVPENGFYLAWDPPKGLLVRRASDNRLVCRIPVHATGWNNTQVYVSADNRFVACVAGEKLTIWRIDGDKPVEQLRRDGVALADFAPDRQEAVIVTTNNELISQPLGNGDAKSVDLGKLTNGPRPRFIVPGPKGLVAVPGNTSARVVDMGAGTVAAQIDMPEFTQHLAWSPDGKTLAASCGVTGDIVSIEIAEKKPRHHKGNMGGWEGLAFDATGRQLLAVNNWNGWNAVINMGTGATDLRFYMSELEPGIDPAKSVAFWRPTAEGVHRAIPIATKVGTMSGGESALHPAGRLAAIPAESGVFLYDLATLQRLGFLEAADRCYHPHFDSNGNLYVDADGQAIRWAVTLQGNTFCFGPPEKLTIADRLSIDVSADGRYVAQSGVSGAAVLDRQTGKVTQFQSQNDPRHVAISPDGSIVAAFGWDGGGMRTWNRATGKLIEVVHTPGACGGIFTPDGKSMVFTQLGDPPLELRSMPDCKLVRTLGTSGAIAVSPDGKYVAVGEGNGTIRYMRLSDGALMFRLDAPGDEPMDAVSLGGNGRYLLAINMDRTQMHVWDLWTLRRRLSEMKLDWESDPLPRPTAVNEPVRVEIVKQ
jgi:serine/threonine protein kinase/WD40 repeat protein